VEYTYRLNKTKKKDETPNKLPLFSEIYVIFYENEFLLTAYHESKQADFSRNKMKEFTSVGCHVSCVTYVFTFLRLSSLPAIESV